MPRPELVLELVVTCSKPESPGPDAASKDGQRRSIWPIVGGAFVGRDIKGVVVAGGGDFPVIRLNGVTVIDALYRLRTDDGVTIIIHNKGLAMPSGQPGGRSRYRLSPEFTAPTGKDHGEPAPLRRQPDDQPSRRQAAGTIRQRERSPDSRLSPGVTPRTTGGGRSDSFVYSGGGRGEPTGVSGRGGIRGTVR